MGEPAGCIGRRSNTWLGFLARVPGLVRATKVLKGDVDWTCNPMNPSGTEPVRLAGPPALSATGSGLTSQGTSSATSSFGGSGAFGGGGGGGAGGPAGRSGGPAGRSGGPGGGAWGGSRGGSGCPG